MKTSLWGSVRSWAVVQPSTPRAPGARRTDRIRWPEGFFFKAQAIADQPARKRGGVGFHAAGGLEFAGQLRHADVVLLRHPAQDEDAVRIEFAVSPAAERLRRNRPPLAKSRHQIDDKRGRHPEMGRRRSPRTPSLDVTRHTLAKIKRISSRHRKSPPTGNESRSHPKRNPHRFNLTVRCSRLRRR